MLTSGDGSQPPHQGWPQSPLLCRHQPHGSSLPHQPFLQTSGDPGTPLAHGRLCGPQPTPFHVGKGLEKLAEGQGCNGKEQRGRTRLPASPGSEGGWRCSVEGTEDGKTIPC